MTMEQILARLAEISAEMLEIGERQEPSEEDLTRFQELGTEHDQLEEKRQAAEKRANRIADIRSKLEAGVYTATPGDTSDDTPDQRTKDRKVWDLDEVRALHPEKQVGELRSRAITAVEKVTGVSDRSKERITRLLESEDDENLSVGTIARHILATSAPDYRKAFARAYRAVANGGMDPEAVGVLQRAMSLTDASGGFAVPLPIDPTLIIDDDGTVNPFRQISTVKTITTDVLRTVSSTAASGSWDGEAGEVSDDATTFANIDITPGKAQIFIPFSIEVGADYPGLMEDLRRLLATEKDDLEAAAFATGSGTNRPVGIVQALQGGSFEIASDTADTFALSDVYDLEEELAAKFRARAVWVANKRIYQAMREAGGANLDDFWQNLGGGQPSELLGYRAYESSEMDGTINAAAENRVLVFGDFSYYWIVDRVGLSIELIPHMFATANNRPSGQRGLYAYFRVGADSVLDRAFRLLNVT